MNIARHISKISATVMCWILVSSCTEFAAIPVMHDDRWDSVVMVRIEPADEWVYEANFEPRFLGKYNVGLVLDPMEKFPVDEFALEGTFRIIGKNGESLVQAEFNVVVDQFSEFDLYQFELSRSHVKNSDRFELKIDKGGNHLNREFSDITFHINRVATIGLTF